MFDPLQVEIAGIQAVFRFLAVQFYVAGPSDPTNTPGGWLAGLMLPKTLKYPFASSNSSGVAHAFEA
jgi:hypothetical protein